MNKIISFILLTLLSVSTTMAQDDDTSQSLYDEAERAYNIGDIDKAEKQLQEHIRSIKGGYRQAAFRILALCQLEKGDIDKAREYVNDLLKANPYYTPTVKDPLRLIDLIEETKQQETGITTASRQVESIEEAPVPVTLITEDMIRHSGATTLRDLLCLYVPGMSQAEGLESNISMHGISGLTQESILFLQDGHRLNGGSSNAESPDYRNSLDKIQQIEVLRGPASSLYGNVALTAVVNIITHKGAKLNGGRISGTIGTHDTYGGSFVVGGGNNVVDITGWGSINSTKGFRHEIPNTSNSTLAGTVTTLYTHAFNKRPSYDIGIKARWGDFTMTINSQRSKQVPFVNIIQIASDQTITETYNESTQSYDKDYNPKYADYAAIENYNYDNYNPINSNSPGTTRTNHHINLDYTHSYGKIDLQASGYISLENTNFYNVLGDSVDEYITQLMVEQIYEPDDASIKSFIPKITAMASNRGEFFNLAWENITFGGQAQLFTKYNLLGHGSAIFGLQYEHFALTEGMFNMGFGYSSDLMITKGDIFEDGMEDIISFYTQIKHYFSPRFILNAGLRYDHKKRVNGERLNYFSPRLSLIYKITNMLSARASYNFSFVDAPFLYRAISIPLLGGKELKPETMKSIQAGLTYHNPISHITAELSGYYNLISDLLVLNIGGASQSFQSSGRLRQFCAEAAIHYTNKRLMFNSNATWQKIVKAKKECNVFNGNRLGVPQLMGNVIVSWAPYVGKGRGFINGGKLWLNGTASAQTTTYYQKVDIMMGVLTSQGFFNQTTSGSESSSSAATTSRSSSSTNTSAYTEISSVKPQLIVGIGATYEWRHLDLSLTINNISNNQYLVGSNMSNGIPHDGRLLLGKVTVKF